METKKYNQEEFVAEILKRTGWTKEEHREYLMKKMENFDPTYDDEDVEIYVKRLNEVRNAK